MTDCKARRIPPHEGEKLPSGIVVMGPFRCATSYLSHLLEKRGVSFGPSDELYEADQWNPQGYYQRPDVLQANEDFLISAGHSVFDPGDMLTLRTYGDVRDLRKPGLDWRYGARIWGLKDPRFCATSMSWFEAGLFGNHVGLIHLRREPLASARSLLRHPELAARLGDQSPEAALQVILRYEALALQQARCFPGPVLSLSFDEVTQDTNQCIIAIDQLIDNLLASCPATRNNSCDRHPSTDQPGFLKQVADRKIVV
jgi:hypothetical protein